MEASEPGRAIGEATIAVLLNPVGGRRTDSLANPDDSARQDSATRSRPRVAHFAEAHIQLAGVRCSVLDVKFPM